MSVTVVASVSQTEPPSEPETFYTPWRVRQLLRDLPHLLLPQYQREEPERLPQRNRVVRPSWGWLEDAIIRKADIERALVELPWFTRQIVYRAYVLGETDTHLAAILRCDRETVRRHRVDGVELMAYRLGWRGDWAGWRRR